MNTQREHVTTADGTTLGLHRLPPRDDASEDEVVVGLHGFTTSGKAILSLLDNVRDGREALAIDLVGHGASDSPDHAEAYSIASVVDQVLSVVGPRPLGTVHLIGYSMGGRVALSLLARAPWYFASVTTISASPGIADPKERAARHDADLALADRVEQIGVDPFVEEWLTQDIFGPYRESLDADRLAATIELRKANSSVGLANSLRGTGAGAMPPVWPTLSTVRSPMLNIVGELDDKYVAIGSQMAEATPMCRNIVVEGAGHVVHDEKPEQVVDLVSDFLRSCARGQDG